MPELPEVEAARRGIAEQLVNKTIAAYDLRLPKLIEAPEGMTLDLLVGTRLIGVERRGKYLALLFPELAGMTHLKLAGQLVARGPHIKGFAAGHPVPAFDADLPHKSTHLMLTFDDDSILYLTDIRHFSRIQLMPRDELSDYWAALKLGPDARTEGFERAWFQQAIRRRRQARLKPLLLDQKFLAGLGNIYVDEALYRARLHPERLARTLETSEIDRLYDAINEVLDIAVPIGGAEILNGKAIPEHGEFPYIHGREGAPCLNCGTPYVKTKVSNRGTYLCPMCQPNPD